MYKLSEFGLNKQSLKRKIKNVKNSKLRDIVKNKLSQKTTKYSLDDIEYIIDVLYSDENYTNKALSVYYSKLNKKKYTKLKALISIKRNGSIINVLKKEIKKIVYNSLHNYIDFETYQNQLEKISETFGINPTKIYEICNDIEIEWLEKIN